MSTKSKEDLTDRIGGVVNIAEPMGEAVASLERSHAKWRAFCEEQHAAFDALPSEGSKFRPW